MGVRVSTWFAAGIAVIALAAMFEAAPRLILLGAGAPRTGSLVDNGSLGLSEAARILGERGASLGLGVQPPASWQGPVVYLLAGPMQCSWSDAKALAEAIAGVAARHQVGIVAAASGNHTCPRLVVEALGLVAPLHLEPAPGLYLALPRSPRLGVFALYNPDRVQPPGGWETVAIGVNEAGDRLPAALLHQGTPVRVVYVPDWLVLSNVLLRAERKAGLDPGPAVAGLVALAAGTESLKGVLVLQPSILLPATSAPAGVVIQPGVAITQALEDYARAEQSLYQRLIYNPFAVLAATIVPAALLYAAAIGPQDRRAARTREPPQEATGPETPSPMGDALALLREATVMALGVEPGAAAREKKLVEALAAETGIPPRLVRKALEAAARGSPPRLSREAILEAAERLAEALARRAPRRPASRHRG